MKYALTGHTRGIGEELFKNIYAECKGFSKSTGYDITKKADRLRIVEESQDCSIFVNNAHAGYGQTELLYEVYNVWKDQDKIIVNIGSDTTSGIKKKPREYSAQKAALDKASEQLSFLNSKCRVMNVKFGFVATEGVLEYWKPDSTISKEDAVLFILQQIEWAAKYRLTEAMLRPL